MINSQQKSAEFIQSILSEMNMPRNQIATLTGLSNPYLKNLEKGLYKKVHRENLIALTMPFNLSLHKTDQLLKMFDRTPLTTEDIPIFLNLATKRELSSTMTPLFDGYSVSHAMLSVERHPGEYIFVGRQPTDIFMLEGHKKYKENISDNEHPLYHDLNNAYRIARKQAFFKNLSFYDTHQYLCIHCITAFIKECEYESEREFKFRKAYLQKMIDCLEEYNNMHIHIVPPCISAYFTLKLPDPPENKTHKLSFGFERVHWDNPVPPYQFGRLFGFQTSNSAMVSSFRKEIDLLHRSSLEKYKSRGAVIDFLHQLNH